MSTPIDKIIHELTELATGLYDYLLRTEGRPERTGWTQQLEHCRKRVLAVRLLAGRSDFRGLHDVCLVQQEYLNALLLDPGSPTSLDWEYLERWPLLVLPCIATPISPEAVDEMVDYCRNVGMSASRDLDGTELRGNLLNFSAPAASSARVVPLPFVTQRGAIVEAPERAPVSEESSVRYLLQHELMDALSEYLARANGDVAVQYEALRLCADRIQLLGLSAAGAGLAGLMDCCLLCHDALNRAMVRNGKLGDTENNALKIWAGLISRYLEAPADRAGIETLIGFYQRGHFIAKLAERDYDNLRELLTRDGAVDPAVTVVVEAGSHDAAAADGVTTAVDPSAISAAEAVSDRLREIEQQLAATLERNTQLRQLTREMDQHLAVHGDLKSAELIALVQSLTEISNESYLASQATQMHINVLGELIAAETDKVSEYVADESAPAQTPPSAESFVVRALLVTCCNQVLAVSINGVERIFHAGSGETAVDDHQLHYYVNNARYDACELETLLQLPVDRAWLNDSERTAILLQHEAQPPRVVFVENVLAAQELEVKPIGPYMPNFPGVVGVTLLGSGELAPVIDLPGLMRGAAKQSINMFATEAMAEPGESV